jgi:hypothetical protein
MVHKKQLRRQKSTAKCNYQSEIPKVQHLKSLFLVLMLLMHRQASVEPGVLSTMLARLATLSKGIWNRVSG